MNTFLDWARDSFGLLFWLMGCGAFLVALVVS